MRDFEYQYIDELNKSSLTAYHLTHRQSTLCMWSKTISMFQVESLYFYRSQMLYPIVASLGANEDNNRLENRISRDSVHSHQSNPNSQSNQSQE